MASQRVLLPAELLSFVDAQLPAIGGAAAVVFRFGRAIPFDWLPGDRQRYSAITLWRTVHVRDRGVPFEPLSPRWLELVLHELIHVEQVARLGDVQFPLRYLLGLALHGYGAHPLEKDARDRAAALLALFHAQPR